MFYKLVQLIKINIGKQLACYIAQGKPLVSSRLECLDLFIKTALSIRENKLAILVEARVKIGILKQMIRLSKEIGVINNKKYLTFEEKLQEISKMATGWTKYLSKNR